MSSVPEQPPHGEPSPPQQPHVLSRGVLLALGTVAFGLGVLGLLLPLIPSVPFFIAAAACFARGHQPLYDWMLRQRLLGPALRDWHQHHALPYWTKMSLVIATLVSFTFSIL